MTQLKSVSIRMYRQGLGDCFLLTFTRAQGAPFQMLIDCGALNSKRYDAQLMVNVVKNIHKATEGRLNVVALTHEHWDHISGFTQAQDVFEQFSVNEVWTAWTEDASRPEIEELKKRFKRKKRAVALAVERLAKAKGDPRLDSYHSAIENVFGFFGGLGANGEGVTERAWKTAMGLGSNRYLDPLRAPLELDELPGVRIYCLGPPADPELIKRTVSKRETYDASSRTLTLADSFLAALEEDVDPDQADFAKPFDREYAIRPEQVAAYTDPVRFNLADRYPSDKNHPNYWRTIDNDWLASAGSLALHLDSYTNNTCLAFAIELEPGGRVLLFPGDAQVGNWLSWETLSWQVPDASNPGGKRTVTSDDLLSRTVFYKVGHHGSHNATLRERGLEKMVRDDLVAMIPVHRKTAEDQDWEFPFAKLWTRLKEKTRGRVLLADSENADEIADDLEQLPERERRAFKSAVKYEKLFVEYTLRT